MDVDNESKKSSRISFDEIEALIETKNYEELEMIFRNGKFNINASVCEAGTVLHYAVKKGDLTLVDFILKQPNVNINSLKSKAKYTPLMIAVEEGKFEILAALLRNKADPLLSDHDSDRVPLCLAVRGGHLECVKELLNESLSVSSYCKSDLKYSFFYPEIAKLLIPHCQLTENDRRILIYDAAAHANLDTLNILFEKNSFEGIIPLSSAIKARNWSVIDFLISKSAKYDNQCVIGLFAAYDESETFLTKYDFKETCAADLSFIFTQAAFYNRVTVLEYLNRKYSDKADLIQIKLNSLKSAATGGGIDAIKYLMENLGSEISYEFLADLVEISINASNQINFTYLYEKLCEFGPESGLEFDSKKRLFLESAFDHNLPEVCEILMKDFSYVFDKELVERKFVQIAIQTSWICKLEMIKFLVKLEVDVNSADSYGSTALLKAADHNCVECVKYLLGLGADPKICDENGNFPLLSAVFFGNEEIVLELLRFDSEGINRASKNLVTPIMVACRNGNVGLCEALILRGAKLDVIDSQGQNVLHYAFSNRDFEDVALFVIESLGDHLIEMLTAKDLSGKTPLYFLMKNENTDSVNKFIRRHEYLREYFELPLLKAFEGGSASEICSICREEIVEDDRIIVLPCLHIFHEYCFGPLESCDCYPGESCSNCITCLKCKKPYVIPKLNENIENF